MFLAGYSVPLYLQLRNCLIWMKSSPFLERKNLIHASQAFLFQASIRMEIMLDKGHSIFLKTAEVLISSPKKQF